MTEQQMNHPARLWLRDIYMTRPGMTKSKAAEELGISHKVLNAIIEGNYKGNADNQLAKLDEQRQRITAQASTAMAGSTQYIHTEIMKRIWNACDCAKAAGLINTVVGVSQIGKTTAARAYRERYPETTILVELLPKPTISDMLRYLATGLRLPVSSCRSKADTLRAVLAALSPRHLIIVDEANFALDRQQGADALDIVRRLRDLSGCGVVLLVTNLRKHKSTERITSSAYGDQLDQLLRRGLPEELPATPTAQDVALLWQAFQLPTPTQDIQRTVNALARRNCFGTLLAIMRLAVAEARVNDAAVNLDHFSSALCRMGRGLA